MHVMHVALGGCLKAPPVAYGLTADTGGHAAYVLGAAAAQAALPRVARIEIVTRLFHAPRLGAVHARPRERVDAKTTIVRLPTRSDGYLSKEELEAELDDVSAALIRHVEAGRVPDVVHAHFADACAVALALRARFDVPVVYTPHSLALDKRGLPGGADGLARRIAAERRALERADAVVCSSRDEAERQIEGYGMAAGGRTHRIDPGVHLASDGGGTARARALVDPALTQPDLPMLLAIARPVPKKNLAALVEAYAATPGLRDAANLVILAGQAADASGAPVRDALRAAVGRHGLAGRVALPPRHAGADVPQLYRLARARRGLFVNPALHEPFGLTLIEAAEAGLPVVATREGGPSDIVETVGHGVCVDPRDPAAIGRACLSLLADADAWAAHAAAARRNAGLYAWDAYADRSAALYARLAAHRDAPALRLPRHRDALVVCDIDGTLSGSHGGAARFRHWAAQDVAPWAIATGRSITEARRVLARWSLPEPHAMITSVGTEIWYADAAGRAAMDVAFAAAIARDWDAEAVEAALRGAGAAMQSRVEQRPFKRSCLGDAAEARRLAAALDAAGLEARVVASHGRMIDVLPARAGKAAAMRHVAGLMGLGADACVACGDSGNDADMLAEAGRAILPANALPDLDALVARGTVHRAGRRHADGVLEGLAAFGLGPRRAALATVELRAP